MLYRYLTMVTSFAVYLQTSTWQNTEFTVRAEPPLTLAHLVRLGAQLAYDSFTRLLRRGELTAEVSSSPKQIVSLLLSKELSIPAGFLNAELCFG